MSRLRPNRGGTGRHLLATFSPIAASSLDSRIQRDIPNQLDIGVAVRAAASKREPQHSQHGRMAESSDPYGGGDYGVHKKILSGSPSTTVALEGTGDRMAQVQRRKKRWVETATGREVSLKNHGPKDDENTNRRDDTVHGFEHVPSNSRDHGAWENLIEEANLEDFGTPFQGNAVRPMKDWGNESLGWPQSSTAARGEEGLETNDILSESLTDYQAEEADGSVNEPRDESRLQSVPNDAIAAAPHRKAFAISDMYLFLETPFDGANGSYGTMFDVTSPSGPRGSPAPPVLVRTIAIHVNIATNHCPVQVFTKAGTHRGFEKDPEAWTVIFDGTIHCQGFKSHSTIPVELFSSSDSLAASLPGGTSASGSVLRIDPGETRAFYVHMNQPNIRYTNGKELLEVTWADQNLYVRAGTGMGGRFDLPYSPRHWNGVLYYETLDNGSSSIGKDSEARESLSDKGCDGEIHTTFEDTIGSFGSMFDVTVPYTSEGVVITGMEIYTDCDYDVVFEVYTRPGSFKNGMLDLSGWSFVAAGIMQGAGHSKGTLIPAERWFQDVIVSAGSVTSFYATLTTADMRYTHPETLNVGDIYVKDDNLQIQVGIGVAEYPLGTTFYGPRVWNGRLYYRTMGDGSACQPTSSPTVKTKNPTPLPTIRPTFAPTNTPTVQSVHATLVTYTYYIEHLSYMTHGQILKHLDGAVSDTVSGFIESTEPLGSYMLVFDLWLDETESALGGEGSVQREYLKSGNRENQEKCVSLLADYF